MDLTSKAVCSFISEWFIYYRILEYWTIFHKIRKKKTQQNKGVLQSQLGNLRIQELFRPEEYRASFRVFGT